MTLPLQFRQIYVHLMLSALGVIFHFFFIMATLKMDSGFKTDNCENKKKRGLYF